MSPLILVFGATGTVGSALVPKLLDRAVPVRVFVEDARDAAHFAHPLLDIFEGTCDDLAAIETALEQVDQVFLMCPVAQEQITNQGTVIEAVQRTGRDIHVVNVSSVGVEPGTSLPLLRWHAVTEAQLRDAGVSATVLRPHLFMQNFLRLAPEIRAEGLLHGAFGTAALPLIDARDVAAVAAEVLTRQDLRGRTYDLTGPDALTYTDVAETYARVLSQSIVYVDLPPDRYREMLVEQGLPPWLAESLSALALSFQSGEPQRVSPAVKQITGAHPRSLDAFVWDHRHVFTPEVRVAG